MCKKNGKIFVQDCKSTNFTFLNDKKLDPGVPMELKKEDMIKIGSTILKYLPAGELEIFMLGSLENAAHTDPLTKAYNKGYVMESLEAEFKRARALHQEFALIIFDLDFFKKINDNYGHDAGDYVLKEVAQIVRTKILPKKAIFGRFGGEEFMILLPGSGLQEAAGVGESLRNTIEKHAFTYDGKKLPITTSVGVAEMTADVDQPTMLFKLADKAVYQSKHGGRNRVSQA